MGSFRYVGLGVLLAKGNDAVASGVRVEAEALAENAAASAAVDTGTLSGGIEAHVNGKTATVTTTAETNPGQALYQEVGSIHNPAMHYMTQAAIASSASLPDTLAAESRKAF